MSSTGETFNQHRMQRCADIANKITDNWKKMNRFDYVIRATDSVHGIDLSELRKRNFSVGVGDDLVDIPLNDVLVVFSLIDRQWAALHAMQQAPPNAFNVSIQVSDNYTDEELVRLLSQLRIETPFDKGRFLRFSSVPPNQAESGPPSQS